MPSAADILREHDALKQHHDSMRSLWDECKRLASPVGPDYLSLDATAPRMIRQLSAVAVQANNDLASGLMSWVIPEAQAWWKWVPARRMSDRGSVAKWLLACTEEMQAILRGSNFYTEMLMHFLGRNESGTSHLWMRTKEPADAESWDDPSPVTFETAAAQDIAIAEDNRGRVHKWFRTVNFSAEQAEKEFGDATPVEIRGAVGNPSRVHERFEFLHCIYKRKEPEGATAQERMPWASIWIDCKGKTIVKSSGFARQPIFTTRWQRWTRKSPYGLSPALIALGEIRGINHFELLMATLAERTIEPSVLVPVTHDGPVDLGPAGVTLVNDTSIPKEWAPAGKLDWGMDFLKRREDRIREIFLIDVFAQFQMIERQMTAYEIAQRTGEKLQRVAPATMLLNTDLLQPMLETLFEWAMRLGLMPPPPEEAFVPDAVGRRILPFPDLVQTNRLAREMGAQTEQAITRVLGVLAPAASVVGPEVFDAIAWDKLPAHLCREAGLDSDLIREPAEVEAVQAARAQAQMQAQVAEAAMKNPEAAMQLAGAVAGPPA